MTPLAILTVYLHPDSTVAEFNKGDMYHQNYKYVAAVSEEFWSRWLEMYVPWLQIRHRWRGVQPNVKVGDLVLLESCSESEGRRDYPKAIIVDTYPDDHEHVRKVKLKLSDGCLLERDIRNIVHFRRL